MSGQVKLNGNRALNMTKTAFNRLKNNGQRPKLLSRIMKKRGRKKVYKNTVEDFEQAILYIEDLRDNPELKDQIDQDAYNQIINALKEAQKEYQGGSKKLDDKEKTEKTKLTNSEIQDKALHNKKSSNKTSKVSRKVKYMDKYKRSIPWWAIDKNGMIKPKYAGTSLDELQKMDLKYKGLVGTFLSIPLIGPATSLIGTSLMKINAELWGKAPEFMQNWLHSANVSINNFIGSPYKFLENGEWINKSGIPINNIDSLGDVLKMAASGVVTSVSGYGFVKGIKSIKDKMCSFFKKKKSKEEKNKVVEEKPWNIFEKNEEKDLNNQGPNVIDLGPDEYKIDDDETIQTPLTGSFPYDVEVGSGRYPIDDDETIQTPLTDSFPYDVEVGPGRYPIDDETIQTPSTDSVPNVINLGPGDYQINNDEVIQVPPIDSTSQVTDSVPEQIVEPINDPIEQSTNENEKEIKRLEDLLQQLDDSKSTLTKEQYEQEKNRIIYYLDREKEKLNNHNNQTNNQVLIDELTEQTIYELQQLEKLNQDNTQLDQYTMNQKNQEIVGRTQIVKNNLEKLPANVQIQLAKQFADNDLFKSNPKVLAHDRVTENQTALDRLNQYGQPTDQYSINQRNEEMARRNEEIRRSQEILNSNIEQGGKTK